LRSLASGKCLSRLTLVTALRTSYRANCYLITDTSRSVDASSWYVQWPSEQLHIVTLKTIPCFKFFLKDFRNIKKKQFKHKYTYVLQTVHLYLVVSAILLLIKWNKFKTKQYKILFSINLLCLKIYFTMYIFIKTIGRCCR
jgi:hypothetical protein